MITNPLPKVNINLNYIPQTIKRRFSHLHHTLSNYLTRRFSIAHFSLNPPFSILHYTLSRDLFWPYAVLFILPIILLSASYLCSCSLFSPLPPTSLMFRDVLLIQMSLHFSLPLSGLSEATCPEYMTSSRRLPLCMQDFVCKTTLCLWKGILLTILAFLERFRTPGFWSDWMGVWKCHELFQNKVLVKMPGERR